MNKTKIIHKINKCEPIYFNLNDQDFDNDLIDTIIDFECELMLDHEKYVSYTLESIDNINKSDFDDYDKLIDESAQYDEVLQEIQSAINDKIFSYEFYFVSCDCSKFIESTHIYANMYQNNSTCYCRNCGNEDWHKGTYTYKKIDRDNVEEFIEQVDSDKIDNESIKILKLIYDLKK